MVQLRVLLADDHAIVLKGVKALIETKPDWQVCGQALNGQDAIKKSQELKPDVVIMDLSMPGLNGLEAAREILENKPCPEVLILTVHESEQMLREALKAGVSGYLLKSDAGPHLLTALEALSRHKTFFSAKVMGMFPEERRELAGKDKGGTVSGDLLTNRERRILQLLAEGKSIKEVSSDLDITLNTAETHRGNLMRKLGVHSTAELVRYALRNHVTEP